MELNIDKSMQAEFDRLIHQIDDSPFSSRNLICFNDVLRAHFLIADYFKNEGEQVIYGVKDITMLGSALGRQVAGFGGVSRWQNIYEVCASLFWGLIKNHPFHDINKRTAVMSLIYHVTKSGLLFEDVTHKELETLARSCASGDFSNYLTFPAYKNIDQTVREILFVADFIRKHSRKTDKRVYIITYHDFDILLRQHGYYLDNPNASFIDVIHKQIDTNLWGKQFFRPVRLMQIGFPGWKRQVGKGTLKEVLKKANLTSQHGCDAAVFFKGADPLSGLIDFYSPLLRRLKDK